jgi:hypothetical protein
MVNLIKNRCYLGEIPDGQGGRLQVQYAPLIDQEIWALLTLGGLH